MRKLANPQRYSASQLLDTYDQDGDNALNLDELKAAMAALYQVQGGASSQDRGGKGAGNGSSQTGAGVVPKKPGEA